MNNFLQTVKNNFIIFANSGADAENSEVVKVVKTALQWVANALMIIGAVLITISLIRTGIKMANADSPEEQQKCKKKILYAILGLVLIVAATVAVNVIAQFVEDWIGTNVQQ